jgi:hypothetical protein
MKSLWRVSPVLRSAAHCGESAAASSERAPEEERRRRSEASAWNWSSRETRDAATATPTGSASLFSHTSPCTLEPSLVYW